MGNPDVVAHQNPLTSVFDSLTVESGKEILRYVISYVVGLLIIEGVYFLSTVISDILLTPEIIPQYWCLGRTAASCLPLREYAVIGLTLALRWLDKYMYLKKKESKAAGEATKWTGLLPF